MIIDPYEWQRVTIDRVTHISARSVAIAITRPPHYRFAAGQYTIVRAILTGERRLVRQYSFSSAPETPQLELTIQKEPHGELSGWLHDQAAPGDTIEITQPFGAFTWEPAETRPLLLLAGGSGIAPCMSILRTHQSAAASTPLTLVYSVRRDEDTCFRSELESLSTPYASHLVTTAESPRITSAYLRDHIAADTLCYICGPKGFIDASEQALTALGVPREHIRHEAFTLS